MPCFRYFEVVIMYGFDLGKKPTKKQKKREQLEKNKRQGRIGEAQAINRHILAGYEVEKKHTGEDFVARKRNMFTGKVTKTKHVEVKTGNARLSKRQKEKKKKGNYKVERTEPFY